MAQNSINQANRRKRMADVEDELRNELEVQRERGRRLKLELERKREERMRLEEEMSVTVET